MRLQASVVLVAAIALSACGDSGSGGSGAGASGGAGGAGGATGGAPLGGAGGSDGGAGGAGGHCEEGPVTIDVDGVGAAHTEVEATWFAPGTYIDLCFGDGTACTAHLHIEPYGTFQVGVLSATCRVSGLATSDQSTDAMACELTMTNVSDRWIGSFQGTFSAPGTPSHEISGSFDACPGGATE
ncbi:MAG: hypothetical protein U0271_43835 [Polyangiaceae bacterium]